MNKHFVNIKVDREERPDIDKIYQTAHQLLTHRQRRLAAHHVSSTRTDQRPFFGGTYFPERRPQYGMPVILRELLTRVAEYYLRDTATRCATHGEQPQRRVPRDWNPPPA